ncbi:Pvc16 family protein [Streptomyces griseoviridis]
MSALPPPVTIGMVDFSLARLMSTDPVLQSAELSFGAPAPLTTSGPLINLFLYRIREDVQRRQTGSVQLGGRESDRSRRVDPPRYAELGYMVSIASKQETASFFLKDIESSYAPLDTHKQFQSLLTLLAPIDQLPLYLPPEAGLRANRAYRYGLSALLRLNQPSEDARSAGEMWTALEVPPRPFLDLAVTIPLLPDQSTVTTSTWVNAVAFDITTGDTPKETTTLTARRIPEPVLDSDLVIDEEQRRVTLTGRVAQPATGARAWLSDGDTYLSDMRISTLTPDGRFQVTGTYPEPGITYTVHVVAVGDHALHGDAVTVDSLETTAPVEPPAG